MMSNGRARRSHAHRCICSAVSTRPSPPSVPATPSSCPVRLSRTLGPGARDTVAVGWPWANGVKLSLHRCKIACVARPGQQVVAGDRLADRIGVGVLTKVFPPELVDRVVDEAGVREQRARALPARGGVDDLVGVVLFFHSSYTEGGNKLVAGPGW